MVKPVSKSFLLWSIFLVALVLRVAYVGSLNPNEPKSGDAAYWMGVGESISQGRGHEIEIAPGTFMYAQRPPLYAFLIGGVFRLFGKNLMVLRLFQALLGALAALGTFFLARSLFGDRVAKLAAWLTAFYPFAIYYAGYIGAEMLFITLLIVFFYLLVLLGQRPSWKRGVACGFFLGLSVLTRPIPLLFPLIMWIGLLFAIGHGRRAGKMFAVVIVTMMVVLSPWLIRNYIVLGEMVPGGTEGGLTFFSGNNREEWDNPALRGTYLIPKGRRVARAGKTEIEVDRTYLRMGLDFVRKNPGKFVRLAGYKFLRFWRIMPQTGFTPWVSRRKQLVSLFSYGLLLPFFVLGLLVSLRRWRKMLNGYLPILYFMGVSMVFYGSTRLRFPISPLILSFAAFGLVWAGEWYRRKHKPNSGKERIS